MLAVQPKSQGVGPRIRQLREARGLSREDLADKAGISPRGLAEAEKDGSNPTLSTLMGVARALGVTLDQLVGQETDVAQRLRLIRLLAEPGETPDDVTLETMKYLRRLMAGLPGAEP